MASLFDLIKYAPENTTPGIAANPYDWSSLPYYGTMPNLGMPGGFDSGSGFDPTAPTYAQVGLPGYASGPSATPDFSFQSTFGGHSGVTQNPDGTFTAQRRVQNNPDATAYETTQYRLSDDGKSLVPVNNQWTPKTIKDTGFFESIGDAVSDFGGVLGEALPTLAVPVLASLMYPGPSGAGLTGGDALAAAAGDVGFDAGTNAIWAGGTNLAATNPALIESAVGTPGYGASSAGAGGGAGVLTGATAGMLPGATGPTVGGPTTGSGLLGSAGSGLLDFVKANPSLLGTLLGGALGGGFSGGSSYDVGDRTPLAPLQRPVFSPKQVDYGQGMPGGLGSQSAGLFADYMRRNRGI